MNAVAYCHPFVPPEWIAAHGLRPCWLPCQTGDEPAVWIRRGVCPVAASRLNDFARELPAEAVVLTTTCDQIRYAAALLQHLGRLPVFLMHVPRTWQTAAVRAFYREELSRLGRFLVGCGGTAPKDNILSQTMIRYDRARASLRLRRPEMSANVFAQAIAAVRGHLTASPSAICHSERSEESARRAEILRYAQDDTRYAQDDAADLPCCDRMGTGQNDSPVPNRDYLPLALVGGPMSVGDYELLTTVEDAGGRFVLDATEAGERTLPAPWTSIG